MAAKVGELIKQARQAAGLTQEKLAAQVGGGVTASDISKAERGEGTLTNETLKKIAKATGVTQSSLLEAAKSGASRKAAAKTTKTTTKAATTKSTSKTTSKTTTKSAASKTTAKATSKTTAKKTTAATVSMKVTNAEKRLVEAYRKADTDKKKEALSLLLGKEESGSLLTALLGDNASDAVSDMISGALGSLLGKK